MNWKCIFGYIYKYTPATGFKTVHTLSTYVPALQGGRCVLSLLARILRIVQMDTKPLKCMFSADVSSSLSDVQKPRQVSGITHVSNGLHQ